jgi:hypothetical protein
MASNVALNRANKAKKDEFYTQLPDIEAELKHYRKQAIRCLWWVGLVGGWVRFG